MKQIPIFDALFLHLIVSMLLKLFDENSKQLFPTFSLSFRAIKFLFFSLNEFLTIYSIRFIEFSIRIRITKFLAFFLKVFFLASGFQRFKNVYDKFRFLYGNFY